MKTKLLLLSALLFSVLSFSQFNVNEGFESGTNPTNWYFDGAIQSVSSGNTCSGSFKMESAIMTGSTQATTLYTSNFLSNGNSISASFSYKGTNSNPGQVYLYYQINNGGVWVLMATSSSISTTCQTLSGSIDVGVAPSGSSVQFRMQMNSAGNSAIFDDFSASQTKPTISSISNVIAPTSTTINYTLNANNSATTSVVNYGVSSSSLTNSVVGFNASGIIGNSGTAEILGLTPNTQYFYQIEATNSFGTTVRSGSFKTAKLIVADYTFDGTLNDINGAYPFSSQAGMSYGTDRSGAADKALYINGTGTTATLAPSTLPSGNSSRTFSIWIKPTQVNAVNRIFSYGQPFGDAAYVATVDPNSVSNSTYLSNVIFYEPTAVNTWKHMVFTYEQSTSTVKIYLNGEFKTAGTFSSLNTSEFVVPLYLGTLFNSTTQRYFGYVDDLKIYNYALTDAQVTSLYTSNTLASTDFNQNNLEVALYPNPANDVVNFETNFDIKSIEFYNIQGQKVIKSNQKQINVSDLATGMYMVRIEGTDNNIAIKKVIIK
jgi:hypothetical protein